MTSNIATLKTLQIRSDPWQEAFETLGKEHRMLSVDNLISIDELLNEYKKKNEYNVQTVVIGDTTVRQLRIIDKHDRVILLLENLELIDGKIYVRKPYVAPRRWFFFPCFRGPTFHLNVRRKR